MNDSRYIRAAALYSGKKLGLVEEAKVNVIHWRSAEGRRDNQNVGHRVGLGQGCIPIYRVERSKVIDLNQGPFRIISRSTKSHPRMSFNCVKHRLVPQALLATYHVRRCPRESRPVRPLPLLRWYR